MKLSVINGLLTSSTISSTDQTANILVQLAGTIAAFTGVPAAPSIPIAPAAPAPTPKVAECPPYEFAIVFDPTDAEAIKKAQDGLQAAGRPTVLTLNVPPPPSLAEPAKGDKKPAPTDKDGLRYRTPTSVVISITVNEQAALAPPCSMKTLPTPQSAVAVVPDSGSTYRLPSTAGAFTTTVASLSFSNGMPTAYNRQRASELLALARIPVDIMKAIVSVPAQILSARINYDNQATAQINAQVELLKA